MTGRTRLKALWQSQGLRFVVIGLWNTLAGYLLFWASYSLLVPPLTYATVAVINHVLTVTQSFVWQRIVVYRSGGNWLHEYARFHLAHLGIFLATLASLALLVEQLGWHPLLAQAVITVVVAFCSYLAHTYFTFRRPPP